MPEHTRPLDRQSAPPLPQPPPPPPPSSPLPEEEEEMNHVTSGSLSEEPLLVKSEASAPGGGFSPHSTTTPPPPPPPSTLHPTRRRRQAAGVADTPPASSESSSSSPETPTRDRPSAASGASLAHTLKQCLAATIKLSGSISQQHAERTLALVTELIVGLITPVQFNRHVEEMIGLPFHGLVTPLLQKELPLLRKEMSHLSRRSNQATTQYVKDHLTSLLDCYSTSSVSEILRPEASATRKRRASASMVENGGGSESGESGGESATPKRPHMYLRDESARTLPFTSAWIPPKASPPLRTEALRDGSAVGSHHSQHSTVSLKKTPLFHYGEPTISKLNGHQADEEWTNIHTMLNCILSMVEKTRKALGILQQRSHENRHETSSSNSSGGSSGGNNQQQQQQWKRRSSSNNNNNQDTAYEASELRRQAGELIAHTLKATEDRVSQVKRKAEEAVQDVKRAAMGELQRALTTERARAERLAAEARRQGAEETLLALGRHGQVKEMCWNCGRVANETCSGCNVARYCSTFCQHKHWEIHHKICGRDIQSKAHVSLLAGTSTETTEAPSPRSPVQQGPPYGAAVN